MFKLSYPETGNFFYATKSSAGFDISANEDVKILPNDLKIISTGLYIVESIDGEIDIGTQKLKIIPEIQIRPRSGLSTKFGIVLGGSPATIDADFRGEIKIPLFNTSKSSPYFVKKGDRIAQGVCALTFQVPGMEVKQVERNENGFGSTG